MARYTALFVPHGDGGFTVEVPTLPGCITEGESFEQALARVREAASLWIEVAAETGREVPVEPEGTFAIAIEVETADGGSVAAEAPAEAVVA